jgi:putative MATE family efflux protein
MNDGYTMDLCHGPLAGKLLRFALPLMASSMLQLLFNAADVVVVGKFAGSASLAAVGSTTYLIHLLTYLFIGLATGANVVAARDWGAGQHAEMHRTVHTAMGLSLISGIGLMTFGLIMARIMLGWMNTTGDILNLATLYLRIYFLGMPAMMVYNFGSALLRAAGDTRRPMLILMLAGVVNFGLNLLFVIRCQMGVAGVGCATAISQYLSAGLILFCLLREKGSLKLYLRKICLRKDKLIKILQIGIPAGIEGIVFSISNVIIQSRINSFGEIVIAGNAACSSMESFIYGGVNTFYQAVMTFVSQNLGAGQMKRIDRSIVLCLIMGLLTGLVLGNLAASFGTFFLGLYATKAAVIQAGMVRMQIVGRTYALCGLMDVMAGSMCGMGYAVMPTLVTIIGVCGVRLCWIFFMFARIPQPWVLYVSYPISWVATVAVHTIFLFWVRRQVRRKLESALERQNA